MMCSVASRNYLFNHKGSVNMKNLLLFLLALTVVPAWAGDAAVEQSAQNPMEKQTAPKHKKKKAAKHKAKQAAPTAANKSLSPATSCPTGCVMMHCPPPGGPIECCNTATYTPC